MTESVSGSSLLQARGDTTHSTSHEHSHNHHIRSHHQRLHHQHQQTHLAKKEDHPAEDSDSSVVRIVQTVDVIQVVDASGATISLKTAAAPHPPPPPPTTTSATPNGLSALPDHKVAVASSTDDDAAAADQSYTPVPTPTPSLEPTTSASLSMSPSFPTVESYAKITSTPLPSGSASGTFPSFSGATRNTTSIATTTTPTTQPIISSTPSPAPLLSNGTATTNGTIVTLKPILETNLTTSTLPNSSGTVLFNASFTTTLQSSDYVTSTIASSTVAPVATDASSSFHATSTNSDDGGSVGIFDGDGSGSGDSTTGSAPSPSATLPSSDDAGSGSSGSGSDEGGKPTPPGTVAGSVIGSVAGVAFLLVLALMLLRWKKRQNALKLRDSGAGPGGLITGAASTSAASASGKDNPFADPRRPATASTAVTAMSQRRSTPFAIPAALANLTGSQRRYSDRTDAASVEGGERGFQKVSGRKLPSVLHYGGDGYSEPGNRDTVMSDQSSYYRDSIGVFSGPGMPRLALGSPMRPESGVPVFHEGPARKAQTETGHFSGSGSNLEPPARDPLGRSHPSQDGSNRTHGSASRFTEEI